MAESMSSAETVQRYCELVGSDDLDGVMALFTDTATVEDPIGSEVKEGREALREFYGALVGTGVRLEYRGPTAGTDTERAFAFVVHQGDDFSMDVIDVMTFDDAGRITSMRAFWAMG